MNDGNILCIKTGGPVDPTAPLPAISPKRQDRIWKTEDLFLGGMKVTELAAYFGVSRRQVYKDLRDARRLNLALVRDFDSDSVLGREINFLEELRRKAMRDYFTTKQEGVKLGFLRVALEISGKLVALLQSTGLLTEVPQRIQFEQSNPFDDAHFRKRYVGLMLEARAKGVPIQGL
jgi:hypothetical protein